MTALSDVLFQLLIFFMLSASMAAYSMLPMRSGAIRDGAAPDASGGDETVTAANATAIWTLNDDGIVASGQNFALAQLAALADALAAQGTRNVLLILRPDVPVQHVVTVLEILSSRGIDSVQIASAARDRG